ncbi:MAG: hypothetical protein Q6351_007615 [Candidatus Njordarchaeum guaymaensis]
MDIFNSRLELVSHIIRHINSSELPIELRGFHGIGKSYILARIVRYLQLSSKYLPITVRILPGAPSFRNRVLRSIMEALSELLKINKTIFLLHYKRHLKERNLTELLYSIEKKDFVTLLEYINSEFQIRPVFILDDFHELLFNPDDLSFIEKVINECRCRLVYSTMIPRGFSNKSFLIKNMNEDEIKNMLSNFRIALESSGISELKRETGGIPAYINALIPKIILIGRRKISIDSSIIRNLIKDALANDLLANMCWNFLRSYQLLFGRRFLSELYDIITRRRDRGSPLLNSLSEIGLIIKSNDSYELADPIISNFVLRQIDKPMITRNEDSTSSNIDLHAKGWSIIHGNNLRIFKGETLLEVTNNLTEIDLETLKKMAKLLGAKKILLLTENEAILKKFGSKIIGSKIEIDILVIHDLPQSLEEFLRSL